MEESTGAILTQPLAHPAADRVLDRVSASTKKAASTLLCDSEGDEQPVVRDMGAEGGEKGQQYVFLEPNATADMEEHPMDTDDDVSAPLKAVPFQLSPGVADPNAMTMSPPTMSTSTFAVEYTASASLALPNRKIDVDETASTSSSSASSSADDSSSTSSSSSSSDSSTDSSSDSSSSSSDSDSDSSSSSNSSRSSSSATSSAASSTSARSRHSVKSASSASEADVAKVKQADTRAGARRRSFVPQARKASRKRGTDAKTGVPKRARDSTAAEPGDVRRSDKDASQPSRWTLADERQERHIALLRRSLRIKLEQAGMDEDEDADLVDADDDRQILLAVRAAMEDTRAGTRIIRVLDMEDATWIAKHLAAPAPEHTEEASDEELPQAANTLAADPPETTPMDMPTSADATELESLFEDASIIIQEISKKWKEKRQAVLHRLQRRINAVDAAIASRANDERAAHLRALSAQQQAEVMCKLKATIDTLESKRSATAEAARKDALVRAQATSAALWGNVTGSAAASAATALSHATLAKLPELQHLVDQARKGVSRPADHTGDDASEDDEDSDADLEIVVDVAAVQPRDETMTRAASHAPVASSVDVAIPDEHDVLFQGLPRNLPALMQLLETLREAFETRDAALRDMSKQAVDKERQQIAQAAAARKRAKAAKLAVRKRFAIREGAGAEDAEDDESDGAVDEADCVMLADHLPAMLREMVSIASGLDASFSKPASDQRPAVSADSRGGAPSGVVIHDILDAARTHVAGHNSRLKYALAPSASDARIAARKTLRQQLVAAQARQTSQADAKKRGFQNLLQLGLARARRNLKQQFDMLSSRIAGAITVLRSLAGDEQVSVQVELTVSPSPNTEAPGSAMVQAEVVPEHSAGTNHVLEAAAVPGLSPAAHSARAQRIPQRPGPSAETALDQATAAGVCEDESDVESALARELGEESEVSLDEGDSDVDAAQGDDAAAGAPDHIVRSHETASPSSPGRSSEPAQNSASEARHAHAGGARGKRLRRLGAASDAGSSDDCAGSDGSASDTAAPAPKARQRETRKMTYIEMLKAEAQMAARSRTSGARHLLDAEAELDDEDDMDHELNRFGASQMTLGKDGKLVQKLLEEQEERAAAGEGEDIEAELAGHIVDEPDDEEADLDGQQAVLAAQLDAERDEKTIKRLQKAIATNDMRLLRGRKAAVSSFARDAAGLDEADDEAEAAIDEEERLAADELRQGEDDDLDAGEGSTGQVETAGDEADANGAAANEETDDDDDFDFEAAMRARIADEKQKAADAAVRAREEADRATAAAAAARAREAANPATIAARIFADDEESQYLTAALLGARVGPAAPSFGAQSSEEASSGVSYPRPSAFLSRQSTIFLAGGPAPGPSISRAPSNLHAPLTVSADEKSSFAAFPASKSTSLLTAVAGKTKRPRVADMGGPSSLAPVFAPTNSTAQAMDDFLADAIITREPVLQRLGSHPSMGADIGAAAWLQRDDSIMPSDPTNVSAVGTSKSVTAAATGSSSFSSALSGLPSRRGSVFTGMSFANTAGAAAGGFASVTSGRKVVFGADDTRSRPAAHAGAKRALDAVSTDAAGNDAGNASFTGFPKRHPSGTGTRGTLFSLATSSASKP